MAQSPFQYFIINKPFGVLSQFTREGNNLSLADVFQLPKDVYPVGRLDADSEGLLILTNDKSLNNKLLDPKNKHQRTYLAQVEGEITDEALSKLCNGVSINVNGTTHLTQKCTAKRTTQPDWLWERNPPIRFRKNVPESWLLLTISEGKNRQVRRMTAAVGFPTLRLVRIAIENVHIRGIKPGEYIEMVQPELYKQLKIK